MVVNIRIGIAIYATVELGYAIAANSENRLGIVLELVIRMSPSKASVTRYEY